MKREIIKGVLLTFIMTMAIACNPKTAEPVAIDKEQIKKEIQAKEDEFAEVYNSGEMRNIGYYADDATTFAQNSPPLVGKPAIIEYLKTNVDSLNKNNKISFTTKEIFVSTDGIHVVEIGYYKVVDSTNTAINTGNYMTLFEKRDGKYYSIRDMSASDGLTGTDN